MSRSNSDLNLLFGILALQLDFVDRDQLVAGMNSWVLDKTTSLADILREQASLSDEEHGLLSALVAKHLEKHRGDAEASLAALSSLGSARAALSLVPDRDVQATLNQVGKARPAEEHDLDQTLAVGQSTSQGARFRVLRPHAKGGLGEVFVARDEELHREVALKEIQLQHAYDQDCRLRFTQEAEITGGLEHPGIVPVYGLGQYADGRPYYAMRFIRGDSLHDAIERFHSATRVQRSEGERALELRKLLGRFVDVCNAIAYAHSRGVLHRDLKPGNIMLGKYGETLVVDWGLAKLGSRSEKSARETRTEGGEKTLHISPGSGSTPTQLGAAMGTPAFMSPEQAAGRIDELGPASDVFSLGATLYCLLTGVAPQHDAVDDVGKILKKVERGEFPRPRQVKPRIPRALEAICLKAMALAPASRYSSPGALAEDIEHWLADEPTTALPESLYDRLFRLARRHRSVALAVTVAAVLIALVTGVASILVDQQRRVAQQLAQENAGLYRAEQQARNAAEKATGAEKLARESAEQLAREKTELALSEQQARSAAVEAAAAETRAREKAEQLAQEKTDLALSEEQARKAAVKAKDAETAARQKADKLSDFLIGAIQPEDPTRFTGATFFAPKADYRSFTVFDMLKVELARARKELDAPLVQAAVFDSVGDVCRQLALFDDAERLLNEALEIRRKHLALGDADLATSCFHTAWYYHERGNFEVAKPLYLEALEIRRKLPQGEALVAETLQNMAWLHYAEKSQDDMDQCFEQALRVRDKLLSDAREQKVSGDRCQPLLRDVVYTKLGWAAANTGLKRPLDVKRIASDPLLRKQLIELRMKNLADALDKFIKAGDEIGFSEFTEAIDDLKQCLVLIKGEGKAETTLAAGVNFVLANTLTRKNRLPEAEAHYRACFEIVRRSQMFQIPEQSPKIMEYGELLRRLGKTSEANQLWEEYLAAQKFRFGDQHRFYKEAAAAYKAFR